MMRKTSPVDQAGELISVLACLSGGQKGLAAGAMIKEPTLTRRVKDPTSITMGELQRMIRYAASLGKEVQFTVSVTL